MAKGKIRSKEARRAELEEKIQFHMRHVERLNEQLRALDRPAAKVRMTKKQKILQSKIDAGAITPEEAKVLGYKTPA